MSNPYIYIDDSGSPGMNTNNPIYPSSTKLYAAIIVKDSEKREIEKYLFQELNKIKNKFARVKEFHAKYIHSGTKEFEELSEEERLNIFEKLVHYYNEFRFPIICTAISEEAINNSGYTQSLLGEKIDNFLLNKPEDLSLMTLIGECDEYIIKNKNRYGNNSNIKVIVDEGRQKAGTIQPLRFCAQEIKEIEYANSIDEILLQFVDFIAFVINRCQINFAKEQSNFDKAFMKIIGKINYNMRGDFINLPYNKIDYMKKEDYHKSANRINEYIKKEESVRKPLVARANKTHAAIEDLKKYMDDNNIKYH